MREKRQTPQERYDAKTAVRVQLKLNNVTDTDILKKLDAIGNKQGYIKRLIRADIAKEHDAKYD